MRQFITKPLILDADQLIFGHALHPVSITPHLTVGNGQTFPEVNYTLPHGTAVNASNMTHVIRMYREMADCVLRRAVDLGVQKLVIEIELVFEMTQNPPWGEAVIAVTREVIDTYRSTEGVHAALRTTVADIRDRVRPPRNRTGDEIGLMVETFERCAPHSDILSIESTGGKEVSDEALLMCDLGGILFALGTLASNDMEFLWNTIVEIAARYGKIAGGDAACGFANTAMQLARQKMIPKVFAAVVRAIGAARSLVAIECGATGPDKDCAYEGPILKAIAGIPISMEGRAAACAHSSPIGNIAMAACDLWSNESVPHKQLFGGFTPAVSLEELWYDCKLMNQALKTGNGLLLRDLLSNSDAEDSVEALVLKPDSCIRLARAITSTTDNRQRAWNAAFEALTLIEESVGSQKIQLEERERPFLKGMRDALDEAITLSDESDYYATMYPGKFIAVEYGLH